MRTWREGECRGIERVALANWLGGFQWQVFATLTYRKPRTWRTILKPFGRFLEVVARSRGHCWSFVAGEWFSSGEALHLHALIGYSEPCLVQPFWEWWYLNQGRAMLKIYDQEKGASYYVTKYICKDEMLTGVWDWLERKDWRGIKTS